MPVKKSFYLSFLIISCGLVAFIIANIHYFFLQIGFLKISMNIKNAPGGVYKSLFYRYRVQTIRAALTVLLRTPLRQSTFGLVNFNIPIPSNSGCIIATCHTQWEGLLVQWCLEKEFGLIIGRRKWKSKKKRVQRKGKGYSNLRGIVRYLQQNGQIIIAADSFNNLKDCPVKFRKKSFNASLLPSRLAKLASVPLIVAIPVLRNGNINFIIGPQYNINELNNDSSLITKKIISFLDIKLKKDYNIWSAFGR